MCPAFVRTIIGVFWDVEDFPIPPDQDFHSFPQKVEEALYREGCFGDLSVMAYVRPHPIIVDDHFYNARISIKFQGDEKRAWLNHMLHDMIEWATLERYSPSEKMLVVIAKDIPEEETDLVFVLNSLDEEGNVFSVVVPDDCPRENVPSPEAEACYVWHWSDIFKGGFAHNSDMMDTDCDLEAGSSQGEKRQRESDDDSLAKRQRELAVIAKDGVETPFPGVSGEKSGNV